MKGKSKGKRQKAKVKSASIQMACTPLGFLSGNGNLVERCQLALSALLTFDFCLLTFDLPLNLVFTRGY
jgi:hypothetical protein